MGQGFCSDFDTRRAFQYLSLGATLVSASSRSAASSEAPGYSILLPNSAYVTGEMVLLNGLPWTAPACPALDARSSDEFYIEKTTNAVYRDYPSYLHAVQMLKARVWGSVCTGAGNLTFEEAAVADARWSELGSKVNLCFPKACSRSLSLRRAWLWRPG